MMAHDSQLGRPGLSAALLQRLASALSAYLEASQPPEVLHEVLRDAAAEAQEKGMYAEDLLVALKDCWYGLPVVQRHDGSEDHAQQLQRVISLCIREYYSM